MHLDPFQDGCYLRLIDHYMETRQPLPDNDAALARIIGISLEQWLSHASGIVRAFFEPAEGGVLTHNRCDTILKEQDKRSGKKSEIGKKGADARWKKCPEINDDYASAMPVALPTVYLGNATGQDRTGQERNAPQGRYAFEGKIIKLNHADFNAWKALYHAIPDLKAELSSIDIHYQKKGGDNWFQRTSFSLNKRHQELLISNPTKPVRRQLSDIEAADRGLPV